MGHVNIFTAFPLVTSGIKYIKDNKDTQNDDSIVTGPVQSYCYSNAVNGITPGRNLAQDAHIQYNAFWETNHSSKSG